MDSAVPSGTLRSRRGTSDREPAGATRDWPYLAGLLVLVQLLVLLGRFTTTSLPASSERWVQWMGMTRVLPQLGLACLTALLLFSRPGRDALTSRAGVGTRSHGRTGQLLAAQLASYGVLFLLTERIFEQHLVGSAHPELWVAAWALTVVTTALLALLLLRPLPVLVAWSRRNAGLVLGACALGVAAWVAGTWVADDLRLHLREPTLWMAAACLRPFRSDLIVDADSFVFGTSEFTVRIAPQCSGFEGIGLALVFMIAYLGVFARDLRFPQALLLPVIGVLAVWFVNAARLATLAMLGSEGFHELAAGGFHSIAGTLAFCAVALGTVTLSRRLPFFARATPAEAEATLELAADPTAAYLVPFLIAVALSMLALAFGGEVPLLDPARTLLMAIALVLFRKQYALRFDRDIGLALVAGLCAAALWLALPVMGEAASALELVRPEEGWSTGALAARLVAYVLVLPLAEEIAFRGYLMRRLTHARWHAAPHRSVTMQAWILSSAAFGLLHDHWIASTLVGGIYGLIYLRSGSIAAAFVAHAFTNAFLVLYVFL